MSAHRTRWWFMGLCAAPVLACGLYIAQLEPASLPSIANMERRDEIDGSFMTRQLERFRLRNGVLPCPRETESKRGGLCAEADQKGKGILLGDIPRAALGPHAVEDTAPEGWRYLIDLSATIPDFCALSLHGPLRMHGRAFAAALLPPGAREWKLPDDISAGVELPSEALTLDACPEMPPLRSTHAEGVAAGGAPWAAHGSKPRPLPEGFDPSNALATTDTSGLILAYASERGTLLQWRMWDGTAERWLALGHWRAPEGMRLGRIAVAGDHVMAAYNAIDNTRASQLADIPLWAQRRAVRYYSSPYGKGEWIGIMPSAEGHRLRLWQNTGNAVQRWDLGLDKNWHIADFPAAMPEKITHMTTDGTGGVWLFWREGKPGAALWRRDAGGTWNATTLPTGKATIVHALFLHAPSRLIVQLREKTAVRWAGWIIDRVPSPLTRESLPSVGSVSGLWSAP